MLGDNIRKYRKSKQMSQDELAERLNVTRQSISLWETGQTQPSLDNIIALAKLFDVSTDSLLTDGKSEPVESDVPGSVPSKHKNKKAIFVITTICLVVFILILSGVLWKGDVLGLSSSDEPVINESGDLSMHDESVANSENTLSSDESINVDESKKESAAENDDLHFLDKSDESQAIVNEANMGNSQQSDVEDKTEFEAETLNNSGPNIDVSVDSIVDESVYLSKNDELAANDKTTSSLDETSGADELSKESATENDDMHLPGKNDESQEIVNETNIGNSEQSDVADDTVTEVETPNKDTVKDIYSYLKNFVIKNGTINGDYCYYSNSADNYGGYAEENFSLYYWGDTQKIEFCLHSVLDDTFSINFYLYVPQTHTGKYDYIVSYYYRDDGTPLYEAHGVIDAAEFTKNYPLNCNKYIGSSDVQNDFMELSRIGICDLLDCLKNFMSVEGLEYSFSDLGFTAF